MLELPEELLLKMYFKMNQARYFEEKVDYLSSRDLIHGSVHLSIGQEASGVSSCLALEAGDLVSLSHRGHSQAIGFGMDIKLMMAELLGKTNGYCRGKGGTMHLADLEKGNIGGNGVAGGGFGLSCGAALTQKYQKTGKIVLCFAGDGATNQGAFHESMNLASIWKLPLIFFIENNGYALSTPVSRQMKIENIADRGLAYDIPGLTIDGNDFLNVYDITTKASRYVRAGKGPVLIEAKTYRYRGHSQSDSQLYRTKEEVDQWKKADPLLKIKNYLQEYRVFSDQQIEKLEKEAKNTVETAVKFAMDSAEPEITAVLDDVYA